MPIISGDGRFVAYVSNAVNLVPGFVDANGLSTSVATGTDVYLFDRLTGVNELVSRKAGTTNVGGNDVSGQFTNSSDKLIAISEDGRYVSFVSQATDLVPGLVDNNGTGNFGFDVFVYDRVTQSNTLVSHLPGLPTATGNDGSFAPSMSGDGRYIAYWSGASNLVTGMSGGGRNVLLYDRQLDTTALVSHDYTSATNVGNGGSNNPIISRDGNYVVYQSAANTLVNGTDTNGFNDVFLYDRATGTNTLGSHTFDSLTKAGDFASDLQVDDRSRNDFMISADGRFVSYTSAATNLISGFVDGNGQPTTSGGAFPGDIFLYDRATGANQLISRSAASATTSGDSQSLFGSVSGDGRFVTFQSFARNLVTSPVGTGGGSIQLYLYDRMVDQLRIVTYAKADPNQYGNDFAVGPLLNHDGSSLIYWAGSSNLVANDFNSFSDAFAYITPPPQVASLTINDGGVQRSMVTSMTVTFDEPVFFTGDPAAAFTLTRVGSAGSVQLAVSSFSNSPNGSITLTFSGSLTQFGSLIDGRYSLSIDASKVSNIANLDGNGDGIGGDNWTSPPTAIFRLFGDADGNRTVDLADFDLFRMSFGGYDIAFDFNNDGTVSSSDFNQFRVRFGSDI